MNMTRTLVLFSALLAIACGEKDVQDDTEVTDDSEVEADADTDTDADSDTDSDSDADSDTDTDADADIDLLVDFESEDITYVLTGFDGISETDIGKDDPTEETNHVAVVTKSESASAGAGVIFSTGPNLTIDRLAITESNTTYTMRVYSPRADIEVRLKVEDANDPQRSVETTARLNSPNTWEILTFDFANEAEGTPELNPQSNFNRASVYFDYGVAGADGGGGTFLFDDFDEDF
jgi:hypothetical protein